ncbi:hypothetical protein ES703_98525 [subsurface metagenome]
MFWVEVDYVELTLQTHLYPYSWIGFNFNESFGSGKDYYIFFEGTTNGGWNAELWISDQFYSYFSSGNTLLIDNTDLESIFPNLSNIWIEIAEAEENSIGYNLLLDYLRLYCINKEWTIPIKNNQEINLVTGLADQYNNYTTPSCSGWFDDPILGKNNLRYTLDDFITTPIFERQSTQQIYSNMTLNDLQFDFSVYPPDYHEPTFTLDDNRIEGKNQSKYNPQVLQVPMNYNLSRFRDSAIDEIQIPLITPIEIDFGNLEVADLSQSDLELILDLNIEVENRPDDTSDNYWNLRSRLLFWNYTSSQWQDYKGIIQIDNLNDLNPPPNPAKVWNPSAYEDDGLNPIHYLQRPRNESDVRFVHLNSNNDLVLPTLTKLGIEGLTENGVMKMIFISYILPGNWEGKEELGPGLNKKFLFYERNPSTPDTPIELNQTIDVNVTESKLILNWDSKIFEEASSSITLPLDENFQADLSVIPDLGKIISVRVRQSPNCISFLNELYLGDIINFYSREFIF